MEWAEVRLVGGGSVLTWPSAKATAGSKRVPQQQELPPLADLRLLDWIKHLWYAKWYYEENKSSSCRMKSRNLLEIPVCMEMWTELMWFQIAEADFKYVISTQGEQYFVTCNGGRAGTLILVELQQGLLLN